MMMLRGLIGDGLDSYSGLKQIDWVELQQLNRVNNEWLKQKAEEERKAAARRR